MTTNLNNIYKKEYPEEKPDSHYIDLGIKKQNSFRHGIELMIQFENWKNERIFRAPRELSIQPRRLAQYPDYIDYIIQNEKGYSDKKLYSYEQLLEYWYYNIHKQKTQKHNRYSFHRNILTRNVPHTTRTIRLQTL